MFASNLLFNDKSCLQPSGIHKDGDIRISTMTITLRLVNYYLRNHTKALRKFFFISLCNSCEISLKISC